MNWEFQTLPPEYPNEKIVKGNYVRVKASTVPYGGRQGRVKEIGQYGVTVEFPDKSEMTYDTDEVYKLN